MLGLVTVADPRNDAEVGRQFARMREVVDVADSATGLTNLLYEVALPQKTDAACDLSTPGKCAFPEFTARKSDSYHLLVIVMTPNSIHRLRPLHVAVARFSLAPKMFSRASAK